ncbi:unnamed protein product [Victoria cruziana]
MLQFVPSFLRVLPLPLCILQDLSEWIAHWDFGGVPFTCSALFKSGEHTCKVLKQQQEGRKALDQQPTHRRISSMLGS